MFGLSKLNFRNFRHNFKDTIDPMSALNASIEGTEDFLLSGHLYDVQRHDLLGTVNAIKRSIKPFKRNVA